MAVGLTGLPVLNPVKGVHLGTTCAGIKYPDRRDLVLIEILDGATCAAVFTRNVFCAAPVLIARDHIASHIPKGLVINTGNANAGTGESGLQHGHECCNEAAHLMGCLSKEVLPFSTGVIGEALPVDQVIAALPDAYKQLSAEGWEDAAWGIMTTDTVAKGASRQFEIKGEVVTVTGIAKGSGMIRPDMATMLAYVATDAAIPQKLLQQCLEQAVATSFNRITVDGDTSTNDACVLIATGQSELPEINNDSSASYQLVKEMVTEVCEELAQKIVRDGEGATKFITINVCDGESEQECEAVAYTIAHSPLVKTAFFASDPNWGRILAAIGRADIEGLDISQIDINLDEVCIVKGGSCAEDYTEAAGQQVMDREEITVKVSLGRGSAAVRVWTCDLSHDYVRINAEYRT